MPSEFSPAGTFELEILASFKLKTSRLVTTASCNQRLAMLALLRGNSNREAGHVPVMHINRHQRSQGLPLRGCADSSPTQNDHGCIVFCSGAHLASFDRSPRTRFTRPLSCSGAAAAVGFGAYADYAGSASNCQQDPRSSCGRHPACPP